MTLPRDVALVGFDGLPPSEVAEPALTTVRQAVVESGERAVQLLLELVADGATEPRIEILPTELVVRESCGAAQRAAAMNEATGETT